MIVKGATMKRLILLCLLFLAAPSAFAWELVIYSPDQPGWLEKLDPEKLPAHVSKTEYDARKRPGDIIGVFPDGTFTGPNAKGLNRKIYRVVTVSNLVDEATAKAWASKDDNGKPTKAVDAPTTEERANVEMTAIKAVTVDKVKESAK